MKWDYLFNRTILERGRNYYKKGKVHNLQQFDLSYQAEVWGSEAYTVFAQFVNENKPRLVCDCPYAQDGLKCKHMAAVLYAIEAQQNREKQQVLKQKPTRTVVEKKRIDPFSDISYEEEYRYFDIKRITRKLIFYDQTCEKAKQWIEDGMIEMKGVEFYYSDERMRKGMRGIARGIVWINRFFSEIEIEFDRDAVRMAGCHVPQCYRTYYNDYYRPNNIQTELCVHETALLFLLSDYLLKNNPGDATDYNALILFQNFRNKRVADAAQSDAGFRQEVTLEPRLERSYDEWKLSFRVGIDKLYVVKNLTEFVQTVEDKGKWSLGKNSEIHFSVSTFAEASQKYYKYIRKIVKLEQERSEFSHRAYRYYGEISEEIKGAVSLYGQRLDDFFELAKDSYVSYTDKMDGTSKRKQLLFKEKDPEIKLELSPCYDEKNVFEGVELRGDLPKFTEGMERLYYIADSELNRVSRERKAEIEPFLDINKYDDVAIRVGRKNLSEFFYTVLPKLREFAVVQENDMEQVEAYLPPEASFVFYLDAVQNNMTCEVKAFYGDAECQPLDWMREAYPKEIFRDKSREKEIIHHVKEFFPEVDMQQNLFHCDGDEDRLYRVLNYGVTSLMAFGEVQGTDRFQRLKVRKQPKLTVGVSVKSDIMNLSVFSDELTGGELLEVLNSYKRKKKYHRLKNGDFLDLDDHSLEELAMMMDALRLSPKEFVKGKMKLPLYRALYLDKMLEQSEGIYTNRDRHFKNLVKEFKTVGDSDYEVPEKLKGVMRNYQIFGYRWLRTLAHCGFGGILADDMGLGKTLQVISVLQAAKAEGVVGTSIVITPASLVYNWQEEFEKFAPELNVCPVVGTQKERQSKIEKYESVDVMLTSYDLLKRDIAYYEDAHFTYQILDEAQYIKNHVTAAAKSVKILNSKIRYALTGTPIENRLSELWSIFDYLMPGFLYGYETFRKELESPIAKNKDEDAIKRLKRMVSPFILRRLKQDVLRDLPDKLEETRYAKPDKKQQQIYDGQVTHMKDLLAGQSEDNFRKNKLQILAELTKIRQICCDPSLLLENYNGGSAKREACMELIESAAEGGHKMLVFSQFTSMLELLEKDLNERGMRYYKITGSTPKKKRVELVTSFNEDDTPVFLISLKAGGTGLNLTGADVVIHYDPWWNQAVQNQATDRAHRIGQTKKVAVYKLIVKGTIEEKILRMQDTKKDLADEILKGEMGNLSNMSKEELLELIQA